MSKLSIVIPSRDEKFLTPTIDDIFRNSRDEQTEVVAVLDSDKWPGDWKEVTDRHPRLHTIHNGQSIGMRGSINKGVASAISRGAKFIAKFDGHCSFSEGFDVELMSNCDEDWIVVPRRGRLDPESWTATDTHKPDIDYHYLSFPDDPNDFGGPGLNGKPWLSRAIDRADILIDDEMSSQGSGWFMHAAFFQRLGLMDEASYGPFWNEFQELGLCAWLSGGSVKVNKKCRYLHLHKGSKHGRGYHLPERWLTQGRNHTMLWPWNEAWDQRQTRPFSWLIEHFWPVPTWPENWEEVLYATRKPRVVGGQTGADLDGSVGVVGTRTDNGNAHGSTLVIYEADYGVPPEQWIDVRERLQSLVKDSSLDIIVNNSTLTPDANPFRGKKKTLKVVYSIDGGERITRRVEEKDWLIIGPVVRETAESKIWKPVDRPETAIIDFRTDTQQPVWATGTIHNVEPMTAAALNDHLIRKFSISPQRLRGPMPIEVPQFHRNDLAELFAELGFKRGAEIGVAEGNYSEVLLKANPDMELLLVDPWGDYHENPQGKGSARHKFSYEETKRKTEQYKGARMIQATSMDAVRDIEWNYLDMVYVDGNHLFDYCVQDLIEWSKRVRSGGIVSGDDYYELDQKRWVGGGVVDAVQAYTKAHRIPIWWLFAGHKSVDFFWCKP